MMWSTLTEEQIEWAILISRFAFLSKDVSSQRYIIVSSFSRKDKSELITEKFNTQTRDTLNSIRRQMIDAYKNSDTYLIEMVGTGYANVWDELMNDITNLILKT